MSAIAENARLLVEQASQLHPSDLTPEMWRTLLRLWDALEAEGFEVLLNLRVMGQVRELVAAGGNGSE